MDKADDNEANQKLSACCECGQLCTPTEFHSFVSCSLHRADVSGDKYAKALAFEVRRMWAVFDGLGWEEVRNGS